MPDSQEPDRPRSPQPGERLPVEIHTVYAEEPTTASLVGLANVILRHRHLVGGVALALLLAFGSLALLLPGRYTVDASFLPQGGGGSTARLVGLASQLGFTLPTTEPDQSPEFYAALLGTNELMRGAALASYRIESRDGTSAEGNLADVLGFGEDEEEERLVEAVEWLRDAVSVRTDETAGLVHFSVRTHSAPLSTAIAHTVIRLVDEYNLKTRQSRAARERIFIEQRLAEAERDLRDAEDALAVFLQRNRKIENSPELQFQRDRLERRVSLHQGVYESLTEAYEQAKIEEVRDTPVITVVERPREPWRTDPRRVPLFMALGLLTGVFLGAALAAGKEFLGRLPERQSAEYEEFARLRRRAAEELTGVFGNLRRRTD